MQGFCSNLVKPPLAYMLDPDGMVRQVRGQIKAPVLTRTKVTRQLSYPNPRGPLSSSRTVNPAKDHFFLALSVSLSVRLFFRWEFHAEKPFCISVQSRQAPKQLRLIAAQLAWTLFIRRSVGIHQAQLAQIRGRAFSFFMWDAALAARGPP